MNRVVQAFCQLPDGRELLAGTATFLVNNGGVLVSTDFRYDDGWLADPDGYDLSPELRRGSGVITSAGDRVLPGAIADSGPDRWGQNLLFAAERTRAKREGRRPRQLNDADFVLMAHDATRLGALRFTDDAGRTFLSPSRAGVPTLVDLDRLVAAAGRHSRNNGTEEDLDLLVRAGTSMGGARPKATVRTDTGRLALAKLPSTNDSWDVQGWEATALELARRAGVVVPEFTVHRLTEESAVLVVDRFDRTIDDRRIGYLSAHSLVEKTDHVTVSYVELAGTLGDHSGAPTGDRVALFRRIALSLLVNNVDDHMKNHGLLRTAAGWQLSPAFDLNPFPNMRAIDSTPIGVDGSGGTRDVLELLASARYFGLSADEAADIVVQVEVATRDWAQVAESFGVEDPQSSAVATAFDTVARDQARDLADSAAIAAGAHQVAAESSEPESGYVPPYRRRGRPVSGYRRPVR